MKEKNNKSMLRKLVTFLPVIIVLVLLFIFGQSMVPGDLSSVESRKVLNILGPLLEKILGTEISNRFIRKLAHLFEYAVLGLVFSLQISRSEESKMRLIYRTMSFGTVIAVMDETIQLFNTRNSDIVDVWIDVTGVTLGMFGALAVILMIALFRRGKTDRRVG